MSTNKTMNTVIPNQLTAEQVKQYHSEGFVVLRNVFSANEADGLRKLVIKETPRLGYPESSVYPTPGKYTISGNCIAEPGFAQMAENPMVVSAVEDL